MLGEDGAEAPGGEGARQPCGIGRLFDPDLAESTAQHEGEELAIVRVVVDEENRRQVAHRPRAGSEGADPDGRGTAEGRDERPALASKTQGE